MKTLDDYTVPTEEAIRKMAKDKWVSEGELEIDEGALVSISDDGGAYVQAWVWVQFEQKEN